MYISPRPKSTWDPSSRSNDRCIVYWCYPSIHALNSMNLKDLSIRVISICTRNPEKHAPGHLNHLILENVWWLSWWGRMFGGLINASRLLNFVMVCQSRKWCKLLVSIFLIEFGGGGSVDHWLCQWVELGVGLGQFRPDLTPSDPFWLWI